MKKVILVAVALFFATGAFAQRGFEWGVKAGYNLTTVSGIEGAKYRSGFAAGLLGEYMFNDFLSVQAEGLFSQEGYRLGGVTQRIDYIRLPVFAKVYLLRGLSADVGVQFGWRLDGGEELVDRGCDIGGRSGKYWDIYDNGLLFGASYKFGNGLGVFARYNLGIWGYEKLREYTVGPSCPFGPPPTSGEYVIDTYKNRSVQIGLEYRF